MFVFVFVLLQSKLPAVMAASKKLWKLWQPHNLAQV